MQKVKGKRQSESLISNKKWTPISTQWTRKLQKSASIQDKTTLRACRAKIAIVNPVVTSKGKFPKSAESKFVQGTVKGGLEFQGTGQRTNQGLETIVDSRTLREIIPTLPFTFQFNKNLKPDDWKDMDEAFDLHRLLKDSFQWRMDTKSFNLASHWEEPRAGCQ
ncbi:hypothetical protein O181_025255 [Austropuccinia psidii MF-1]|uniref:Uncharacterized protein n=1 Tax=Austropuccinia psidii MF-1 TaxID=1389203 RepID=A0A9Q3CM39_9BASI|nr:hypothetical protein [Austropuccinia psidii MF-1]